MIEEKDRVENSANDTDYDIIIMRTTRMISRVSFAEFCALSFCPIISYYIVLIALIYGIQLNELFISSRKSQKKNKFTH